MHAAPLRGLWCAEAPVKLMLTDGSDSTSHAMLYDMRGTYIRRDNSGFQDNGMPSLRMIAVGVLVSAALLYLSLRWGMSIGLDGAALYAP